MEGSKKEEGISIVILKYRIVFYNPLIKNISETCGALYEIITIDNTGNNFKSIAKAYNSAISHCNFQIVCFLHEDLLFLNKNWGVALIKTFAADENIGLVGLFGAKFKSYQTTSYTNEMNNSAYLVGGYRDQEGDNALYEEAVCIDGLFMATKRAILKSVLFDEKIVKGFHGYDLDFSLSIHAAGYKTVVAYKIDVQHFSSGNRTMEWYLTNKAISDKWCHMLPAASGDLAYSRLRLMQKEFLTIVWLTKPFHPYYSLIKTIFLTGRFLVAKTLCITRASRKNKFSNS